jgi:hypothetical protein
VAPNRQGGVTYGLAKPYAVIAGSLAAEPRPFYWLTLALGRAACRCRGRLGRPDRAAACAGRCLDARSHPRRRPRGRARISAQGAPDKVGK